MTLTEMSIFSFRMWMYDFSTNDPLEVLVTNELIELCEYHRSEDTNWENAQDLYTALKTRLKKWGYKIKGKNTRNQCDYKITLQELELFHNKYLIQI